MNLIDRLKTNYLVPAIVGLTLVVALAIGPRKQEPDYIYKIVRGDVNGDGIEDRIIERRKLPYGHYETFEILYGIEIDKFIITYLTKEEFENKKKE